MITNIKNHPKYWDWHKEIYFNQLDSLDDDARELITSKPNDIMTIKFHEDIDRKVSLKIKEHHKEG